MKILLPRDKGPNHGLHRVKSGTYYVRWCENGVQRIKTTGTKDVKEARKIRDARYARFEQEQGALRSGSPELALTSDRYITMRPPYIIKVPGQKVREAGTLAEARLIRNELLTVKGGKP